MSTGKNKEVKATASTDVVAETSQGEVTQETHVVTQQTLEDNPDLVGVVEIGEEIGLVGIVEGDKYIVIYPFADKDDFTKTWNEGDDVSHFDSARLASCIERELVKKA